MQEIQVQSLIQEDPTSLEATKLLSLCSRAHELQLLSLCVPSTEACLP